MLGVTHILPQSLTMEMTAGNTVRGEAGVHHVLQQTPKGKKEAPLLGHGARKAC